MKFTLITDHKSLTTILGPKKGVPAVAAARLQRWAVQLWEPTIMILNFALRGTMEMLMPYQGFPCLKEHTNYHQKPVCIILGRLRRYH